MKLEERIVRAIYGNRCILCDKIFDHADDREVCQSCDAILRKDLQNKPIVINDISITADKFLFTYNNKRIRKMVLDMKEDPLRQNCKYFARIATECIMNDPVFADCEIITYCPRKPAKERYIGYDHSGCFAEYIAERSGKTFMKLLKRREGGKEQKTIKRIEHRIKNVHGKFYFNDKMNCKGKSVLLVDDIITSGSTVKECARILKEAGAAKILALFILD